MRREMKQRVGSGFLWCGAVLGALLPILYIMDRHAPPDLTRAETLSVQVIDQRGRLLRAFTTPDGYWRLPTDVDAVDGDFLRMLLAYEDRRFHYHPGVDPLALLRALGQWLRHGRIVSGGSTLTMQVARLLEPMPRTLTGKLRQMLRALQLEWHYDKDEILAMYLQLAPYGGNLEGIAAASRAYFGKSPQTLTLSEAALLVVLPQSPERLRPDRHPEAARAARDKVLERMVMRGVLTVRQAAEAAVEPIPGRRLDLPFHAPHLAERLRRSAPERLLHRTTLDGDLQRQLEDWAERALTGLPMRANLAALVVRNRDRTVLAHLGSAAFHSPQRAGQVDLTRALRSPGSALKPIIYGLGFDVPVVHPETLVDDRPTRFGGYQPDNFLNVYHGRITLREALQRSLNVPAVAVLERLGPARVATRLQAAGIRLIWSGGGSPGLPLVLGGVGTTLSDLVTLYAAIAAGGEVQALRYTGDTPQVSGTRLLSTETSALLAEILAAIAPPEGVSRSAGLAFKTGTSYGYRDAWALGFDADYTIGVWVGRPDGTPIPGQHGRNTAAPLLFQIADLLPGGHRPPTVTAPRTAPPAGLRHLQRFDPLDAPVAPPRIVFPVQGSMVELQPGQQALPLVAEYGQPPLRWLINGRSLEASSSHQTFWPVDGPGAARATVIDALGRSASVEVWVE